LRPVDFVHTHIREIAGYVPGLQTDYPEILKLNTNENPFPIADSVREALVHEIDSQRLHKYPDPISSRLREALGEKYGRPPETFLIGNGSDEILSILFRAVLGPNTGMVCAYPTYSLYPVISGLTQASCQEVPVRDDWHVDFQGLLSALKEVDGHRRTLCAFANPNAPTGIAETEKDILSFVKENAELTLVDEAYADFGNVSVFAFAGTEEFPRLLVAGTASKALSLAGQRIGWLCGEPAFIRELEKLKDSYNVSRLAQAAALAAVKDTKEHSLRIAQILDNRDFLVDGLGRLGFETLPSSANFIFTRPPGRLLEAAIAAGTTAQTAAAAYYDRLLPKKILVRYWSSPALKNWIRITIGTREQMERLLHATAELI